MFEFTSSFWVYWLLLGGLFIIILYLSGTYSNLRRLRRSAQGSFSTLDHLFRQRDEDIPKLVVAVQKYQHHEQTLFTKLAKARHMVAETARGPENILKLDEAEREFKRALGDLLLLAEQSVEQDVSGTIAPLLKQIRKHEVAIADCQKRFNRNVQIYNELLAHFPYWVFSNLFGWNRYGTFQVDVQETVNHDLPVRKESRHRVGHV